MGKKAFIEVWNGEVPPAPSPAESKVTAPEPADAPVAAPEAAPAATAPATPAPANGITLDQLQTFAAILLVKRLRELRSEEEKQ